MAEKYLVKDYMDEYTYNKLLSENCKDILQNDLKVGDKVAYGTATTDKCVCIGEITEIWLEYTMSYNWQTKLSTLNTTDIYTYVKIKGLEGSRGVTRRPQYIVKIV